MAKSGLIEEFRENQSVEHGCTQREPLRHADRFVVDGRSNNRAIPFSNRPLARCVVDAVRILSASFCAFCAFCVSLLLIGSWRDDRVRPGPHSTMDTAATWRANDAEHFRSGVVRPMERSAWISGSLPRASAFHALMLAHPWNSAMNPNLAITTACRTNQRHTAASARTQQPAPAPFLS
jgi:hypothetical protein